MSTRSHPHRLRVLRLLALVALLATLLGVIDAPKRARAALTPTITWDNPANIVYGTPLNALQLDATADVPGSFSYTPAIGTVLKAGKQSLKVLFTPNDTLNYDPVEKTVQITVDKAQLTIKANNATKVYGAALPSFAAIASGLVNGDTLETLATPPSFTSTANVGSSVGSYAITPNAADPNYTITAQNGTLTITQAPLTIKADDQTMQVGKIDLATLTFSYVGFVNGDDEAALTSQVTFDPPASNTSLVGSYPIIPKGATSSNYTITFVPGTLTVTPKLVLTLTWNAPAAITYGTALGATRLNAAATIPGSFSYDPPAGTVLNVGKSQTLKARFTPTDTVNYAPVEKTVKISVDAAPLTLKGNDAVKVYGATLPTFTATPTGLVNGDTLETLDTPLSLSANASATSDVGSYAITPNAADPNYTITFVPGALTITPAPLTIKADDKVKLVNAPLPTWTFSYIGFVNADNEANLNPLPNVTTTVTTISPVGDYTLNVGSAASSNYTITFVPGTLFIRDKLLPTVTWPNPAAITYGMALGAAQLNATADVLGAYNYTPAPGTMLNVGNSQTLKVRFTPNDGSYEPVEKIVQINVQPAALTISANNASKVYGDALPAFTATPSGLVNGDTMETLETPVSINTPIGSATDVGSYSLVPIAFDSNYNITIVTGTLTVTPAPLTISADNKIKPVGAPNPSLTASYSGFVNDDSAASLSLPVAFDTTATETSPVGSYPITPKDAANPNYTITFVPGTLTVTPKQVPQITWANPAAITYGTALGATELNATAPIPGSFNYDPPAGTVLHVGNSQTLEVRFTPDDTVTYEVQEATVTIDIQPAPLTITANNVSKMYGAALPTFSATASGLVNGDTLDTLDTPVSYIASASRASAVNSYLIMPDAFDANYNIRLVRGTLTVTPAPLTISADNKIKTVGTSNPPLTASYTGFVNNDSAASLNPPVAFDTTASDKSPVGSYPITPKDAANPNYTITFMPGTLTITAKQVPQITWTNPAAITYGTALGATELNAASKMPGSFSYDPPAGTVLHAGNGRVLRAVFIPNDSATYATVESSVSIDVLRAELLIRADNKTKTVGTDNPPLTATYTGFVNGDTAASLDTAPKLTTSATKSSAAGSYPIAVSGASDADYTMTYIYGTLMVEQAAPTAEYRVYLPLVIRR